LNEDSNIYIHYELTKKNQELWAKMRNLKQNKVYMGWKIWDIWSEKRWRKSD